ncbi:membrane protein [Fulvitalea axinellae]|uniref:Membrane protein n=1 Tax=Fulvitalea axinellae TaxID=1182444 RepID=A0AAU9D536_9BACT|nr:membrane protein [Fulvitalea axinellae]
MRRVLLIVLLVLVGQSMYAQARWGWNNNSSKRLEIDYSNPKEYEIAEITVEGAETLNKSALISLSGLKVGDKIKIPGEGISGAIKKLWKQGIIANVAINVTKVEDGKVWLTIHLTERPRLTKIEIQGVNKTQEKELQDEIDQVRGRVLTDAVRKNAELATKRYFVGKGFLDAKVNVQVEKDSLITNGSRLVIDVNKGRKVHINRIRLLGATELDPAKSKKKMKKTREKVRVRIVKEVTQEAISVKLSDIKTFFSESYEASWKDLKKYLNDNVKLNFFNASKFIGKEYENDKAALVAYYNSKGYRDARILGDSVYVVNGEVNIDIKMYEGKKYFYRDIKWVGNYIYTDEQLNKVLKIGKGDVYNRELMDKRLQFDLNDQDISSLYMDNGYLAFRINPVEVRVEGDSIDVEMRINEGARFKLSNVAVSGNDRTNDHVVYRELRTLPGELFSRRDIIRTQRELSSLGYFDPETINPDVKPNMNDETVDLTWEVVERPSDQIELSGGWGGAYGFIGTLGLTFNNFSFGNFFNKEAWRPLPTGDGQKLSVRAQANGKQYQSYSISFQEPWLGGRKPQSFSASFSYSNQREFNYNTREYGSGSLGLFGITVGLGHRLKWPDDNFSLNNSISYYRYDVKDYYTSLGFSDGKSNNLSFTSTLSRYTIDQPMYPRGGSSFSLSVSLTPPYSIWRDIDYNKADNAEKYKWVEYYKIMFDAKQYTKVVGNLVVETKAHFGFINSYKKEAGIGPFERYIMGGSGLAGQNVILGTEVIALRGYDDAALTGIDDNGTPNDRSDDIEGGVAYTKVGAELRYPVSLNPSATIYVHGFVEAGNTWNDYRKYNPFDLYKSAGFGARIFMPAFGLIGIDWGYGFDDIPGQLDASGSQFHFTIGQQLR